MAECPAALARALPVNRSQAVIGGARWKRLAAHKQLGSRLWLRRAAGWPVPASEPREFISPLQRDPEVETMATGAMRMASRTGRERTERSEIRCLPQRDAV